MSTDDMKKVMVLHDDITEAAVEMIQRIIDFDMRYPGALQKEFLDFLEVVEAGAKKYALNNWMTKDGKRSSNKDMHDSMFHHLAESFTLYTARAFEDGSEQASRPFDLQSGLPPELHLACRALMVHTRRSKDIIHPDDLK